MGRRARAGTRMPVMPRWRRDRSARKETRRLRLYYASDVHGSDVCWRKFLNAAGFYSAPTLIMGGDITGKALSPIVRDGEVYSATLFGETRTAHGEEEMRALESEIRDAGIYPWHTSEDELARVSSSSDERDRVFSSVLEDELRRWMRLAEERLRDSGGRLYLMPGNDDPLSIDPILASAEGVIPCDDAVVAIDGHELLSLGWSNRTPWDSPRELDEDDLYRRLKALADQLESPATAIFNLHVPPIGSGLDTAAQLDADFSPVTKAGMVQEAPVGSTAVRQILEEVQPALTLHGHIHESRGIAKIGRTVAVNPGSEYGTGRIHGLIAELEGADVRISQLVSG
jgi:uncharacterized protein